MLTVEFEQQEGITVPYPPLFDGIRKNSGFVDLRGHPDLAAKIPEASQSYSLKSILIELANAESSFFTIGCDLGAHEDSESDISVRHVAGGYVQIMDSSYENRSSDDYLMLAKLIKHRLEIRAQDHNWILRFVLTFVDFHLDDFSNLTPSLWIWFYGAASTPDLALLSRETLIRGLHDVLADKQILTHQSE